MGQVLTVTGGTTADIIILKTGASGNPNDATSIDVFYGGADHFFLKSAFTSIAVTDGTAKNDVYVDLVTGNPILGEGFTYSSNNVLTSTFGVRNSTTDVAWAPTTTANSGVVTASTTPLTYSGIGGGLDFRSDASLSLTTPAGADAYILGGSAGTGSVSGTSAGTAHSAIFTSVPALNLNFGTSDGAGTIVDSLQITSLTGVALNSVSIATGNGNDQLTLAAGLTSLALPATGGTGLTFNGGGDTDTVTVSAPGAKKLTNSLLTLGAETTGLNYLNSEVFNLGTGAFSYTGADTETAVWTPSATVANTGTLTAGGKTMNFGGSLDVQHVASLTLQTLAGADNYVLGTSTATVGSLATAAAVALQESATFSNVPKIVIDLGTGDGAATTVDQVTVNSFTGTGLNTVQILTGAGADQLTLASGLTSLALPASGGTGFSFDGGADSDTVTANAAVAYKLTESALTQGVEATGLNYTSVETFNLNSSTAFSFVGDTTENAVWTPGALAGDTSTLTYGTHTVHFAGSLDIRSVASLKLLTLAGADAYVLGASGSSTTVGSLNGGTANRTAHLLQCAQPNAGLGCGRCHRHD